MPKHVLAADTSLGPICGCWWNSCRLNPGLELHLPSVRRVGHSACLSLWWLAVMTHSTLCRIPNYFRADHFSYGSDLIAIPEGERGAHSSSTEGEVSADGGKEQRESVYEYLEFSETCVQRARDNKRWQMTMWDFISLLSVAVEVTAVHYNELDRSYLKLWRACSENRELCMM